MAEKEDATTEILRRVRRRARKRFQVRGVSWRDDGGLVVVEAGAGPVGEVEAWRIVRWIGTEVRIEGRACSGVEGETAAAVFRPVVVLVLKKEDGEGE